MEKCYSDRIIMPPEASRRGAESMSKIVKGHSSHEHNSFGLGLDPSNEELAQCMVHRKAVASKSSPWPTPGLHEGPPRAAERPLRRAVPICLRLFVHVQARVLRLAVRSGHGGSGSVNGDKRWRPSFIVGDVPTTLRSTQRGSRTPPAYRSIAQRTRRLREAGVT